MAADNGDFRPRGGPTPQPDNTLAGADNIHPDRRVDVPREIHPMTMDFEGGPAFQDFRPIAVDSDDVLPPEQHEVLEPESDPKDLSVLESVISSELPDQTKSESSANPVNLVHAGRASTPPKANAPGMPPSLRPPNLGQSEQPAKT